MIRRREAPTSVSKSYSKPFIVSRTNLSRLCDVIQQRFDRLGSDQDLKKRFSVDLADGREYLLSNLESVFNLDNAVNNSIRQLGIAYRMGDPEDEASKTVEVVFRGGQYTRIRIDAAGPDFIWLNETVAEIEEQIDRVIPKDFAYRLKPRKGLFDVEIIVALLAMLLTIVLILMIDLSEISPSPLSLSKESIEELVELSASVQSDEDKTDFLYRYLAATLEKRGESQFSAAALLSDVRFYAVSLPVLLIIGLVVYLVACCYPRFGFVWGDWEDHYKKIVERRKAIWNAIVLALVVGIIGDLLVFGLIGP